MPTKKLPSETSDPDKDSLTENHEDWSQQFLKHLEINLLDAVSRLSDPASLESYQQATVLAVIETLRDSGMEQGAFTDLVGQALASVAAPEKEWLPQMSDRRMKLIDKSVQQTITVAEQIELARLTSTMRSVVDSESSLPMEGAKALHHKLLSIRDGAAGR